MFLINKSLSANTIVCTVTENTTVDEPVYTMVVHSDYTHKTFTVLLGDNITEYINRFDKFIINADFYSNIDDGKCTYQIYQTEDTTQPPVEIGYIVFVTPTPSIEYLEIEVTQDEDDFIIFEQ